MILRYFYDQELAQASYLIGCAACGEALIIDPNRHIKQYMQQAQIEGIAITGVTETHIHADYVSGARELAAATGATLYLSDEGTDDWKYSYAQDDGAQLIHDGGQIMVGNIRIDVIHTPGHTPEHVSFLVTDQANADQPMGIVTGDFIFVGDVGRPDLLEKAAKQADTMEEGARQLFRSIQNVKQLPDFVQIWPGHGAGSPCGRALGAVPQSTIGYERLFNWAFQAGSEQEFVDAVVEGQPEPPTYFAMMKKVNKDGPTLLSSLRDPVRLDDDELETRIEQGMRVVDTRSSSAFAGAHIPGTISIGLDGSFIIWSGWLIPYDEPFALIIDESMIESAVDRLRMIGLDNLAGYWTPDVVNQWAAQGKTIQGFDRFDPAGLASAIQADSLTVLDVRGISEFEDGHIPGSIHIPLGYLEDRIDEVPRNGKIVVNCGSGYRSTIGASLLMNNGFTNVGDLVGGFAAWEIAGQKIEY